MAEQGVSKSVDEGLVTAMRTDLIEAITGGAERKMVVAPTGSDRKVAATIVIPATLSLDTADDPEQLSSCVLTDDEGNVFNDVYKDCVWTTADAEVATVNSLGVVTPVGDGGPINITATMLGASDTCAVTVATA